MKKRQMTEIPAEQLAKSNGAFVAIVCREIRPYVNYSKPISGDRRRAIPRVLMQVRWDGLIGFPGGKVDPGETLRQACVREAREEIGIEIPESVPVPVCSHLLGNFAAHLYAIEVGCDVFRRAVRGAWDAEDAEAEVCGVITPNIEFTGPDTGIAAIFKAPMAFSARRELLLLIERLGLLGEEIASVKAVLARRR